MSGSRNADWGAIDNTLVMKGLDKRSPEEVAHFRQSYAYGHGGLPLIGSPDDVAKGMADIAGAGFDGIAVSLVGYARTSCRTSSPKSSAGSSDALACERPPKNSKRGEGALAGVPRRRAEKLFLDAHQPVILLDAVGCARARPIPVF